MGILHIEDLKIDDFITMLRKINELEVSEKIDGTINIAVGVDEKGLFVCRPAKNQTEKIYESSWSNSPKYNAFRFAFSAFKSIEEELSSILKYYNGIVEFEVLYGYMPNVIAYQNEGLVILRTITGPDYLVEDLAKILVGKQIKAHNIAYHYTLDGSHYVQHETHNFTVFYKQIVKPPKYDATIDIQLVEKILNQQSKLGISNWNIVRTSLSSVRKNIREDWKKEKIKIETTLREIKVDIKKRLQDVFLYDISSTISPDVSFIEGVVLRNQLTNEMVKIVDRDVFTDINRFLWHYRELIESGIMTEDGWKKSILVTLREKIGDAFNIPLMKTLRGKKLARENPIELFNKLRTESFEFIDSEKASDIMKQLVLEAIEELEDLHLEFRVSAIDNTLSKKFQIGSKNINIKYNEEIIGRTLDIIYDVKKSLRTVSNMLNTVNESLTEYEAWINLIQIYSMI